MSNGLIYVPTANCKVIALNAKTGEILWEFALPERPARRGVAVGDDVGLVFAVGSTGSITAINAETGERRWTHRLTADPAHGRPANITSAPTYARGVLLVAISGGDSGRRGGVSAIDVLTGKEMWRFYVVPQPGERGSETWPNNEMWRAGGGPSGALAVDTELGLVYFGWEPERQSDGLLGQHPTKHPGPHRRTQGPTPRHCAVTQARGLDFKTGAYRWHFQLIYHDIFDMDVVTPVVLCDTTVNGRPRKGLRVANGRLPFLLIHRWVAALADRRRPVPQDPFQTRRPHAAVSRGGDQVVPNCVEPWLMPPGFKSGCYFTPLNQPNQWCPISARARLDGLQPETDISTEPRSPVWATRFGISVEPDGSQGWVCPDSRTNKIAWQQRTPYRSGLAGACWRQRWRGISATRARTWALDAGQEGPLAFQIGAGAVSRRSRTSWIANDCLAPWRAPQGGSGAQSPGDTVGVQARGGSTAAALAPLSQTFEVAASLPDEPDRHRFHGTGQGHHQTACFESMSTRPRAAGSVPAGTRSRGRTRGTSRIRSAFEVRDGRPVPSSPMQPIDPVRCAWHIVFSCDNHPATGELPGEMPWMSRTAGRVGALPAAGTHGRIHVGRCDRGNLHQHGGRRFVNQHRPAPLQVRRSFFNVRRRITPSRSRRKRWRDTSRTWMHKLQTLRMLEGGKYNVNIRRITNAETALVHPTTIDLWVVLEGSGTLTTGGTIQNGKIVGGQSHTIRAGDVEFITATVPHGVSGVQGSITWLNIRWDNDWK